LRRLVGQLAFARGCPAIARARSRAKASRARNDRIKRDKQPDATQSQLVEVALKDAAKAFESADSDFRFAASVASFGMLLRESPYRGQAEYAKVLTWANTSRGADEGGLRAEFVRLAGLARSTTRN